jgi:hypothetical protein
MAAERQTPVQQAKHSSLHRPGSLIQTVAGGRRSDMDYELEQMLEKCRYAREYGFGTLSTGEGLIVALPLN